MKISSICLKKEKYGLRPFKKINLGENVILTGKNGSGKTRLLKLLVQYIESLKNGISDDSLELEIENEKKYEELTSENVNKIKISNYSHYDARIQPPDSFTPYVICKAKDILRTCNYEETALNSFLLLDDMAHGYSKEFSDRIQFNQFADKIYKTFNIKLGIDKKTNRLTMFDMDINESLLSPGQQYLLRIAIACYRNNVDDNLIFLLDEPELHLHPQALIELINVLRQKFSKSQFWISTHSLALISYMTVSNKDTTVLYLEEGNIELPRSNSSKLLTGLIGDEKNRFAIRQLFALPDEYACNKFAVECFIPPVTLESSSNDPQTNMIQSILKENDVVLDYGAGKGRFFEELALTDLDIVSKVKYYAYDKYSTDSNICKQVMNKYGANEKNYFNNIDQLLPVLKEQVDYILLINVLHEIPPKEWLIMFETMQQLLKATGKLIIVEREELMIGEYPYDNGFLMITKNGAKELFCSGCYEYDEHPIKKYIVKYTINKSGLSVNNDKITRCIKAIKVDSLQTIKKLKSEKKHMSDDQRFRLGIKLAFHLQQYANANLIMEEFDN